MPAPTKLSIYNGANRLLGERSVTLTEDRPARYYLDDAWDDGLVDSCLEEGYWTFATRSVLLEASTSLEPSFGYSYAFEKPYDTDYIKTSGVYVDPEMRCPLIGYSDEAGVIYCNYDVIYFQYVSNGAAYGGNMSLWPQSFEGFVQASLADAVKELVTGNDGKYDRIKKALKAAKLNARNKDVMNKSIKVAPHGSFVTARMNSRFNRDGSN